LTIVGINSGVMRIVAWNCNMALDRKVDVLLELAPDIAVVCECAEPERLRLRSRSSWMQSDPVWIGRNPHKGLAVFAFNGYGVRLAESYRPGLRYIAPVHVRGPAECNLLAVWAQNASAGGIRKHQLGPLRRALSRYKSFLGERPAVIAGDLNSNTIWDKPGWRINHSTKVRILEESFGLVSAYHAIRGEAHGAESEPTLYWRDRAKDGPTYHIDYVFMPALWIDKVRKLSIGTFETWCGSGLSDHVPVVVDVDI
jgi:exodeoxyribonuclease-3